MSYKGLIIKIQALQANYNREIEEIKDNYTYYNPECTKTSRLMQLQEFSDELDKVLKSEEYAMKKHFKYI